MGSGKWITLPVSWKLQDVQAALNVIIAFLCAASVFVLVRQFWVIAARQVAKKKDVPAYALLSLNTIGETIDVVWLLRHELLSHRYRGLLFQCIFVVLLTVCTITSGFIARFSTRSTLATVPRLIEGSLAARDTDSLMDDSLDINAIAKGLRDAKVPTTELLEFWPDPNSNWQYNDRQWNSSWTMQCDYNESVPISDLNIVTSDCGNGFWEQWPAIYKNWEDWYSNTSKYQYYQYQYDWMGWSVNSSSYRDILLFVYGVQWNQWKDDGIRNITYELTARIVAIHLHNVPRNVSDTAACTLVKGPIDSATYTSANCHLKRDLGLRSSEDLDAWGAGPDYGDISRVANSYTQEYAGRLRRESDAGLPLTRITGQELVTLYQAYMISKDTSGSLYYNTTSRGKPRVQRTIDVQIPAAEVSLIAIIVCAVTAGLVLFGLVNYWMFLLLNLKRLDEAPQSKLDWMLHFLRRENDKGGKSKARHKLRASLSGEVHGDAVPLTDFDKYDMRGDKRPTTTTSSIHGSATDVPYDHTPATVATDFTGETFTPHTMWPASPPQNYYQQDRFQGLGIMNRQGYGRVPSATDPYASPYFDTAYDPGKRWAG